MNQNHFPVDNSGFGGSHIALRGDGGLSSYNSNSMVQVGGGSGNNHINTGGLSKTEFSNGGFKLGDDEIDDDVSFLFDIDGFSLDGFELPESMSTSTQNNSYGGGGGGGGINQSCENMQSSLYMNPQHTTTIQNGNSHSLF